MPQKRVPAVKVETHRRKQERLVVNSKTRLVADKIFHYGLFSENEKIAAVFQDEHGINLAVFHLKAPISAFLLLLPPPATETTFSISPDDKKAIVTYRADGMLYIAESDGMYVSRVWENDGSIEPLGGSAENGGKKGKK